MSKIMKTIVSHKYSSLLNFKRFASKITNYEVLQHRAKLFDQEKQRQINEVVRIEKIEVKHVGAPAENCTLLMNKSISTPYNCAMHISELLSNRSVIALVNGEPWDMHRPLESDCELKFLHFKDEDPDHCNKAYWRSCSLLLGYVFETSFKENHFIDICSFPPPFIKSGSFVYDMKLGINDWKPSKEDLRCLTISASKIHNQKYRFDRLIVKPELAQEIFKYNKFKLEQIPSIASKNDDKITIYKVGDFVDISKGPMISNTSMVGRFEVTGIFDVKNADGNEVQRIQGISIPTQLHLHAWTFGLLARRAAKLNKYDQEMNRKRQIKNEEEVEQNDKINLAGSA